MKKNIYYYSFIVLLNLSSTIFAWVDINNKTEKLTTRFNFANGLIVEMNLKPEQTFSFEEGTINSAGWRAEDSSINDEWNSISLPENGPITDDSKSDSYYTLRAKTDDNNYEIVLDKKRPKK
jgi:hypothetical protein